MLAFIVKKRTFETKFLHFCVFSQLNKQDTFQLMNSFTQIVDELCLHKTIFCQKSCMK